jgi:uncharacterized protein involved in exopolysaccharide biosynthesis
MTDPAAGSRPGASPDQPATSLLRLAATLLRRWRFIVAAGLVGAAGAAAWALLATPRYRSTARFALEERRGISAAGGLAALAGQLGGGTLGGIRSLQFYAEVLVGQELLEQVVLDTFPDPDEPGARKPLIDILDVTDDNPRRRLSDAVDKLRDAIGTSTNDRTGTITLDVALPDPDLAAAVTARLYQRLERFNIETRKSSASERREFASREITKAQAELRDAEAAMRNFLEANRGGLDIPRLNFQRQQLQRRIDLLEESYSELARELQEARIDEVRDTPVFTLVQRPAPAPYREFPKRVRMTLIGGLLGGALAVFWLGLKASGWTARTLDPVGYEQLRSAVQRRPA